MRFVKTSKRLVTEKRKINAWNDITFSTMHLLEKNEKINVKFEKRIRFCIKRLS